MDWDEKRKEFVGEFKNIPEELYEVVEVWICACKRLTVLSDSLDRLTSLRVLCCFDNELTSLPDSLGSLTSLQWLDCSNNKLTSLPDSLGDTTSLLWLDCSSNQLTSLPESLGDNTSLQLLDCSDNKLTSLPESLGKLHQLVYGLLFCNKLSRVHRSIVDQIETMNRAPHKTLLMPAMVMREWFGHWFPYQLIDVILSHLFTFQKLEHWHDSSTNKRKRPSNLSKLLCK